MSKWRKALGRNAKKEKRRQERELLEKREWLGGHIKKFPAGYLVNDPAFKDKPDPNYKPEKLAILKAKNEFIEGTVTFKRKDGIWVVVGKSESMEFLKVKNATDVKFELLQRGFSLDWVD